MMDKMKPQGSCLLSVPQACILLLCRGELPGAIGMVQGTKTHRKKWFQWLSKGGIWYTTICCGVWL